MANRYDGRNQRRATKKQARAWMAEASDATYLPPPNSGKVPKGTVLRGSGPYDRRAKLLDQAATEWLRASKRAGHTAITDQPYRRQSGKSITVGAPRIHGTGPSTRTNLT